MSTLTPDDPRVASRGLGDDQLTVIDGLALIGPEEASLLHDGLHPSPEGYRLLAQRLLPIVGAVRSANAH